MYPTIDNKLERFFRDLGILRWFDVILLKA